MGGGLVVGHGLHQAQVAPEGVFNQILAVAGDGGTLDYNMRPAQLIDVPELFQNDGYRVALVGVVVGVEQSALGRDEGQLCGGGAGVDAQVGVALVAGGVRLRGTAGVVPGAERVVFLPGGEQRGHGVHDGSGFHGLLQLLEDRLKGDGRIVGGAQGRAHGGEAVAVGGEYGVVLVQAEGFRKPLAQAL